MGGGREGQKVNARLNSTQCPSTKENLCNPHNYERVWCMYCSGGGEERGLDGMGLEGKGGDLKSQAAFLEFLVSAQEPSGKYQGYGLTQ